MLSQLLFLTTGVLCISFVVITPLSWSSVVNAALGGFALAALIANGLLLGATSIISRLRAELRAMTDMRMGELGKVIADQLGVEIVAIENPEGEMINPKPTKH